MVVVVELDVLAFVVSGMTVGAISRTPFTTPNIILGAPLDVVGDDQIKPAIFVVIEPARAGGPASFVSNTSSCRDIGKGTVAIVVIKNRAPITGDIQIGIAIIVEVSDSHALAVVPFSANAGFLRHVGEGTIAVIVVKRAAQGMRWFVDVGGCGLNEVQIHQAILVVIDPSDACAHGFKVVLFFSLGGILLKGNFGALADVGVADRNSGVLLFRGLRREQDTMNNQSPAQREHQDCSQTYSQGSERTLLFGLILHSHRLRSAIKSAN